MMKQIFILLFLLAFTFITKAQSGDISGRVDDRYGSGIDNVTVSIVDSSGKATGHGSKADSDGNYSINPLSPGMYNVQASAEGFLSQNINGIIVSSDKSTFVDLHLQPDPNAVIKKKKHPRYHKIVSY